MAVEKCKVRRAAVALATLIANTTRLHVNLGVVLSQQHLKVTAPQPVTMATCRHQT